MGLNFYSQKGRERKGAGVNTKPIIRGNTHTTRLLLSQLVQRALFTYIGKNNSKRASL